MTWQLLAIAITIAIIVAIIMITSKSVMTVQLKECSGTDPTFLTISNNQQVTRLRPFGNGTINGQSEEIIPMGIRMRYVCTHDNTWITVPTHNMMLPPCSAASSSFNLTSSPFDAVLTAFGNGNIAGLKEVVVPAGTTASYICSGGDIWIKN